MMTIRLKDYGRLWGPDLTTPMGHLRDSGKSDQVRVKRG